MNVILSSMAREGIKVTAKAILGRVLEDYFTGHPFLEKVLGEIGSDGIDFSEKKLGEIGKEGESIANTLEAIVSQPVYQDQPEHYFSEIEMLMKSTTIPVFLYAKGDSSRLCKHLFNEYRKMNTNSGHEWVIKEILEQLSPVIIRVGRSCASYEWDAIKELYEAIEELKKSVTPINSSGLNGNMWTACLNNELLKTEEFSDKWKSDLFLDNNISLHTLYPDINTYLIPEYIDKDEEEKPKADLKERLKSEEVLENGLVILGPPGIGKSTLLTWFCNSGIEKNRILAYSLADIFSEEKGTMSSSGKQGFGYILERTDLKKVPEQYLAGKILLLDGLDEIAGKMEKYSLSQYAAGLMTECRKRKICLILTCRTNYIEDLKYLTKKKVNYITLKPWNRSYIEKFIDLYCTTAGKSIEETVKEELCSDKKLFGIPLLLYMVLALDISVGDVEDKTDLYDRIFDKNGRGIFVRCVKGKDNTDEPYDSSGEKYTIETSGDRVGATEADMDKVKKTLEKSREIAFTMFESGEQSVTDPFKNWDGYKEFFKSTRITEGEHQVQFIHRSMYEYFAVDYLIEEIEKILPKDGDWLSPKAYEPLAEVLAHFGKRGRIIDNESDNPEEISLLATFTESKLKKLFQKYGLLDAPQKLENLYFWWEEGTYELLTRGILPYAYRRSFDHAFRDWASSQGDAALKDVADDRNKYKYQYHDIYRLVFEGCRNSRKEELNCCKNILDLLNILYKMYHTEEEYAPENRMFFHCKQKSGSEEYREYFSGYVKSVSTDGYCIIMPGAYLSYANLSYANLSSADLSYANLSYAYLSYADLRSADLSFANLSSAYLNSADLRSADLNSVYLRIANLSSANLSSAYLGSANLLYADLSSANLSSADLGSADLRYAYLSSADLRSADLRSANLRSADLSSADLSSADLSSADLSSVDLSSADLSSADLSSADMEDSKLTLKYKTLWSEGDTFPIERIGYAKFNTIYVDDKKYTRKEFFDTFQPGTDYL